MDAVAQEQILSRLREAVSLAESGCAGHLDRLRELFSDLADRAEALDLVRHLDRIQENEHPVSILAHAMLSSERGEPASEFLLIPFGEVALERPGAGSGFVFTRKHAESAQLWFEGIGRKLAIDYEHQSFDRFNTRSDGLRPAAGWIGGLEIREDGLWAVDVAWTDRAKELLCSGEYRYFSPVIFWTDEDRSDVAALGPVALTNDPAMRGVATLAASRQHGDVEFSEEAVDRAPESPATGPVDNQTEFVPREELITAEQRITLLTKQLATQEADTFVERGMRLGKIQDSTSMDWREDYLRDPECAEDRLSRAPVLLPPGRVLALNRRGEVEPLSDSTREFSRHGDLYRRWGIGPEDLAAFERAATAGRIIGTGLRK